VSENVFEDETQEIISNLMFGTNKTVTHSVTSGPRKPSRSVVYTDAMANALLPKGIRSLKVGGAHQLHKGKNS
jgi:hypothetical protein